MQLSIAPIPPTLPKRSRHPPAGEDASFRLPVFLAVPGILFAPREGSSPCRARRGPLPWWQGPKYSAVGP